jgi:hypothetical protein
VTAEHPEVSDQALKIVTYNILGKNAVCAQVVVVVTLQYISAQDTNTQKVTSTPTLLRTLQSGTLGNSDW